MSIPTTPLAPNHKIRNPYLTGLWPMLGITALFLAAFLVMGLLAIFGIVPAGALLPAGLPVGLFGLITIIAVLIGERQVRLIRDFLGSDRPQVRWSYTQAEWDALRESTLKEARENRLLPLGCLAFLLGMAGLMVGAGVAANDASLSAFDLEMALGIAAGGLLGALAGGLAGGLIGGVVVLGNLQTARQNYRQKEPGEVALCRDEIYALGQYVKVRGGSHNLSQVEWEHGYPTKMMLTISTSFPRRGDDVWEISVPERVQAQVEELFPQTDEA